MISYSRSSNILEYVSGNRKCSIKVPKFQVQKCGHCKNCQNLSLDLDLTAPKGKNHKIPFKNMDCHTKGVIYRVVCDCGKCYIGRTVRKATLRISEHRRAIDEIINGKEIPEDEDGISGSKDRKRFYTHMAKCNRPWTWNILDRVTPERFCLEAAEKRYIKLFRPALNTQLA